jgi:hypothetical protein
MLDILLTIPPALAVGWYARVWWRCSPSCRGGSYLWTPELERAAFDRGRGVGLAEGRGELTEAQRVILAA